MIDIDINEIKENDVLNNVSALEKNNYGRFIITFRIGNEWYRLTTVNGTHFSESFSKRFIKQSTFVESRKKQRFTGRLLLFER